MNAVTTPPCPLRHCTPPGIVVRGLSLHFAGHRVFDDLDLDIQGGDFMALLGASGVGKTSLLKIIAGLARASAGSVLGSDGQPLDGRVAYMGQQDLLYPWLTVRDNVTLGARLRGDAVDHAWAEHLLAEVGLAGSDGLLPAALSGGMRQRAAVARTLYERRPIVLMDEPFSALDTLTRARLQALAAQQLRHCTVLLITHDPLEACRLGRHVRVLAGQPARLGAAITLDGEPPRASDDPQVLLSQGRLLRELGEQAS